MVPAKKKWDENMHRVLTVALPALLMLAAGSHNAFAARNFESKDLFSMQWAADPQIRKDGGLIAYGRISNNIMTDHPVESLWLIDVASGTQTPLATETGWNSSPRWSPDGTRVAFLRTGSDGRTQIFQHWLRTGKSASMTTLTEAPHDIAWSPDGKQIAFIMLTPEAGPTIGTALQKPVGANWADSPIVIDAMNFRADGQGLDRHGYYHIFVLPVAGGAPRQLTFGSFSDAGPLAWSPDGESIFFAGNRNEDWSREPEDWARHTAMTLSIYRLGVADGVLTQLSHDVGPYHAPVVSPDGKQIAFLGYRDRHVGNQNVRLNVMGVDGKNPREVGTALDRSIADCQWAADGRTLFVQYVDRGATKIAQMSLDGHLKPVAQDLAGVAFGTIQMPYSSGEYSVSGKDSIAYTGGASDHLPDVYLMRDGKSQRLTNLNSGLFAEVNLGKVSELPVKSSADGRPIGAWMMLPPNFDPANKYPLILEIHGGPYASYSGSFSADFQVYAAAGYIVVWANPRGSTSYGEEFANTIYNNYPSQDYDDLMSVVDAAIQRGNVDPDNLFVTGASGGGILTSWIVGKTHRFRAAVTQRPVINWTSWTLTSDMYAFAARYWFKKFPWEDQETYWKHSPLANVGNVTTPTMVIVGLADLRTTVGEAEQFYHALQLLHIPTELYEIPGAAHVAISPSQAAAQSSAILAWFERYRKK
jgi:dipeptidyl aminopeptidase/acylaminoacyl peptidase